MIGSRRHSLNNLGADLHVSDFKQLCHIPFAQATPLPDHADYRVVTPAVAPQLLLIRSAKFDLNATLSPPHAVEDEVWTIDCTSRRLPPGHPASLKPTHRVGGSRSIANAFQRWCHLSIAPEDAHPICRAPRADSLVQLVMEAQAALLASQEELREVNAMLLGPRRTDWTLQPASFRRCAGHRIAPGSAESETDLVIDD
jgi:hypothetical protein